MVETFLAGVLEKGASASVGLASEAVIQAAYPDVRRTYLKFAEGGDSGCNLFALARPDAADALGFWQEIDRNRKKPLKLIRSVDIKAVALYAMGKLVERFFGRMKDMRRLTSRSEKPNRKNMAIVHLFAIRCWLG